MEVTFVSNVRSDHKNNYIKIMIKHLVLLQTPHTKIDKGGLFFKSIVNIYFK